MGSGRSETVFTYEIRPSLDAAERTASSAVSFFFSFPPFVGLKGAAASALVSDRIEKTPFDSVFGIPVTFDSISGVSEKFFHFKLSFVAEPEFRSAGEVVSLLDFLTAETIGSTGLTESADFKIAPNEDPEYPLSYVYVQPGFRQENTCLEWKPGCYYYLTKSNVECVEDSAMENFYYEFLPDEIMVSFKKWAIRTQSFKYANAKYVKLDKQESHGEDYFAHMRRTFGIRK